MSNQSPIISCICITVNRPKLLDIAIKCFLAQDYPDKELLISYPTDDQITKNLVENFLNSNSGTIKFLERNSEDSLGHARNQLIRYAAGTYICIWDDDDWYHPSRLSYQYNQMILSDRTFNASILTRIILFDKLSNAAYLSFPYTWDGSLLCRKEVILQNPYALITRGEDTHIIKFLDNSKMLLHISEAPYLYIYIYHGNNTWGYPHFQYFKARSELLNQSVIDQIKSLISQ